MNNHINYYYNLYPDDIHEQNKTFYFYIGNDKYYFINFNRPIEDAPYLYELNIEMIRKGSLVHEIIPNKDKNVLTFVNDIPYILMRVYVNEFKNSNLPEIIFISMENSNIKTNKILDRSNWAELWSTKIDYFEYQFGQVGKQYPIICEYFSYYIGLAENAISYVKNTTLELTSTAYDNLTLAHKRIREDDTLFNLYNPVSFVIDYPVRDLGEYIKTRFFSNNDAWPELDEYFRNYELSPYSKRLLYARLLFPSYFFDVYESIIEGKIKEESILPIVQKASLYEDFLNEFYIYMNRNHNIPAIDWLNKKNN